jgi:hypothetical protein
MFLPLGLQVAEKAGFDSLHVQFDNAIMINNIDNHGARASTASRGFKGTI